ncbi:unnamed protein product [Cladocopium goreaui]|uniref:30S ribosomal protein S16 n=1 Tax=Cladocopium goreaui TaxID=2562237 RepID=A0A9P1GFA9_9DINO|nr:unnamed protein product [Cladocopium goreaui]
MFRSSCLLVRKMFLPFYSKEGGPPRIRQQVVGTKGRRFFKLVACNQKDKQNGKHMEVLGSYAPKARSNVKEIRLRFSRVKATASIGGLDPYATAVVWLANQRALQRSARGAGEAASSA